MSTYSQIISHLEEKNAYLEQYKSTPLNTDQEIIRRFPMPRVELRATALAFLNKFTSVLNTASISADTAQYYVTSPQADRGNVTFPGRWRLVSNIETREDTPSDKQGIVQTLRYGFLQEIDVEDTSSWDEARLLQDRRQPQIGNTQGDQEHYIRLQFVNVDPNYVETLATSLALATFTDPYIKGQLYTGTFHVLYVGTTINEEDGSGIIELALADAEYQVTSFASYGTPSEFEVIYLWGVPKDDAQGIIDGWKAATTSGSGVTVNYSSDQSLVGLILRQRKTGQSESQTDITTLWNCRFREYTSFYWGLTSAEFTALLLTEPPTGETRSITVSFSMELGLYSVQVRRRVRQAQTRTDTTEYDSAHYTSTQQRLGASAASSALTKVAGIRKTRRIQVNEDCTLDELTSEDHAIDQTSDQFEVSASQTVSRELHTQNSSALDEPTQEDGKLKRAINRITPYGWYETVSEEVAEQDQTSTSYVALSARSETRVLHTAGSAVASPSSEQGKLKRVQNTPTALGLYRTEEQTVEFTNQASTSYEVSPSREVTTSLNTHATEAVSKPTETTGKILRANNVLTEVGTYRTEEVEIVPSNQTSSSYRVNAALSATEALSTETTAADQPSQEDGKLKTVRNVPTAAGNYRVVSEEVEVTDQTGNEESVSARATSTRASHTQGSLVASPAQEDGKIKRISNVPTPAGLYRTVSEEVVVNDQTETSYEVTAARTSTMVLHTENSTALTEPSQTDGTIYRYRNSPTEAGLHRTVAEAIVVSDQTSTSYFETAARSVSIELHTENSAVVDQPAQEDGKLKRVNNRPNASGYYQTVEEETTMQNQSASSYEKSPLFTRSVSLNTENTAVSEPAEPSDGTIVSVRNVPTESGKARTEEETIVASKKETSESWTDRYGTSYLWTGVNCTEDEFATTLSNASLDSTTRNSVSKHINRYGLIDYTIMKSPYRSGYSGSVSVATSGYDVTRHTSTFYKEREEAGLDPYFLEEWKVYRDVFRDEEDAYKFAFDSATAVDAGPPPVTFQKIRGKMSYTGVAGGFWIAEAWDLQGAGSFVADPSEIS